MSSGCSPPQDDEQGVRGHQQQDPPGRLLPGGSRLRLRGQGTEEPQQNHRWVIVRTGVLHCHCHRCFLSLHCLNSTNVDYSTPRSGPCRPALRRLLPKGELSQQTAQSIHQISPTHRWRLSQSDGPRREEGPCREEIWSYK